MNGNFFFGTLMPLCVFFYFENLNLFKIISNIKVFVFKPTTNAEKYIRSTSLSLSKSPTFIKRFLCNLSFIFCYHVLHLSMNLRLKKLR